MPPDFGVSNLDNLDHGATYLALYFRLFPETGKLENLLKTCEIYGTGRCSPLILAVTGTGVARYATRSIMIDRDLPRVGAGDSGW